jgi:5'-nucleotidase
VRAPGLLALKRAVEHLGDVMVLAPDHNWSAAGHTKTLHRAMSLVAVQLADGSPALATDGAPSDCVAMATLGIAATSVNLVISGINHGPNLGSDVTYSGTVAAAMEAYLAGVPSIAVSLDVYDSAHAHYETAARFVARLAALLLERPLASSVILNVNVPNVPSEQIAGIRVTRLGKRLYRDVLEKRVEPSGSVGYVIGGERPTGLAESGTDIAAIADSCISVTPLHLDLTAHDLVPELEMWLPGLAL